MYQIPPGNEIYIHAMLCSGKSNTAILIHQPSNVCGINLLFQNLQALHTAVSVKPTPIGIRSTLRHLL